MPITDWPISDRPREKMLQKGEEALTDAELVAIFLKTGTYGKTALDLARELLAQYGSLKALLTSPLTQLAKTHGLGEAKCLTLKAAAELGRRYVHENIPSGAILNSSQQTRLFLAGHLRHQTNEVFACIFMDTHFRLLSFEKLFEGTIHSAHIYPREIVKRGLMHNAAKIILAHNHPSGLPTPSQADKEATELIKQALSLVDIDVVDHLIIGNPGDFSFADAGLIHPSFTLLSR